MTSETNDVTAVSGDATQTKQETVQTELRHRFQVDTRKAFVMEMEDIHFHHDSAVLLPDFEPKSKSLRESPAGRVNGLAVLCACYLHAEEAPDQLLMIAGHTDTTGKPGYNMKLSKMRADSVMYTLIGNRDKWVGIALKKNRIKDYKLYLAWTASRWGWLCSTGEFEEEANEDTEAAVKSFQIAYNKYFDKSITEDGIVGRQTWGAFFDVFMRELQFVLETDEEGLKQYRSKLKWVDESYKAVGCGEQFPIEAPRRDEYYSATNRRVELLFFEPSKKPSLNCRSGNKHDKSKCEVYDSRIYRYDYIDVDPVPELVWIHLQTVDVLGVSIPKCDLHFSPEGKGIDESRGEYDIQTNKHGYWSGRVNTAGNIRVTLADGTPVRLGTDDNEKASTETAVIDPRIPKHAITDVIVTTGKKDQDLVEKRDKLVRRYGRLPVGVKRTRRSGGGKDEEGEPRGKMHARGGKGVFPAHMPTLFRRTWGNIIADNLAIAAAWTKTGDVDLRELLKLLDQWLRNRHGTPASLKYFVTLIYGRKLILCESPPEGSLQSFDMDPKWEAGGRYGAHSGFADREAENGYVFVDMASALTDLIALPRETKGKADQSLGDDQKQQEPIEPQETTPSRQQDVMKIWKLVVEGQRKKYTDLVHKGYSQGKVDIVYHVPATGYRMWLLALHGGTGLLENYPVKNQEANSQIHSRNKNYVRICVDSYKHYLKQYIDIVNDKKRIKTHTDLWNLGPPLSPFQFPMPLNTTKDQRLDLYDEQLEASPFQAWQAIGRRLEDLFGMIPEGLIWLKFEFSFDSGNMLGMFHKVQAKWNFTVDSEGKITPSKKIETSGVATLGKPAIGKSNWTLGYQREVKINEWGKKEAVDKAFFKPGCYGFETDQTGTVKMTGRYGTFAEANLKTAQAGYGIEFSLKEFILNIWKKRNPGRKIHPDLERLPPDFKLGVGLFFQGLTVGTALAFTSKAPGFFERRPVDQLLVADWDSLYSDERLHLKTLAWEEDTWNGKRKIGREKFPDSATKDFWDIPAEQKVAAVHLGLPARDPYWQNFWKRIAWGKPKK